MFSDTQYKWAKAQMKLYESGKIDMPDAEVALMRRKIKMYDHKWANIDTYNNKKNRKKNEAAAKAAAEKAAKAESN